MAKTDENGKAGAKEEQGVQPGEKKDIGEKIQKAVDETEPSEGGSFLDTLYNKITDVIGGENANQYFCMVFPGTLVEASDYSYDIKGEKPAHVKAN